MSPKCTCNICEAEKAFLCFPYVSTPLMVFRYVYHLTLLKKGVAIWNFRISAIVTVTVRIRLLLSPLFSRPYIKIFIFYMPLCFPGHYCRYGLIYRQRFFIWPTCISILCLFNPYFASCHERCSYISQHFHNQEWKLIT